MTFFPLWNIKYDICFHRGLMKVHCNQNCLVSSILNIIATEESKSCRFGTTRGWVKHHNVFHFWVNYPFNVWSNIFKSDFCKWIFLLSHFHCLALTVAFNNRCDSQTFTQHIHAVFESLLYEESIWRSFFVVALAMNIICNRNDSDKTVYQRWWCNWREASRPTIEAEFICQILISRVRTTKLTGLVRMEDGDWI